MEGGWVCQRGHIFGCIGFHVLIIKQVEKYGHVPDAWYCRNGYPIGLYVNDDGTRYLCVGECMCRHPDSLIHALSNIRCRFNRDSQQLHLRASCIVTADEYVRQIRINDALAEAKALEAQRKREVKAQKKRSLAEAGSLIWETILRNRNLSVPSARRLCEYCKNTFPGVTSCLKVDESKGVLYHLGVK